jgi:predicted homoserine dehydrogenase-like protein
MIIVDNALKAREAEGRPIRVGLIGSGFMAQGLCNTIANSVPGMVVVALYGRRLDKAIGIVSYSGLAGTSVSTGAELSAAVAAGKVAVTDDPYLLTQSEEVDVLVELTGSVEFGAGICLDAFAHGKSVVLMNAELDATIGPLMHVRAREHGVIMSATDGDEPGLQMNLVRWVQGLGLTPRIVGNVKGLQDPYRNPTTQAAFAEQWGQNPAMVTSFADGSKISFEQTIVANATGFTVASRGMSRGLEYSSSIMDIASLWDYEEVRSLGGIVDYTVGPALIKAYVLAEHDDPKQQHYLSLYKLGPGPLYPFWVPYHLPTFECPSAIARVVLFGDDLAPPLGGPTVEVCAVAKRDLEAGEVLDDYGMYMTYGEAVAADEMSAGRYLPEGLVEGCKLRRAITKDTVITYDDVDLPDGRLADRLRAEQYTRFRRETWLEELLAGQVAS